MIMQLHSVPDRLHWLSTCDSYEFSTCDSYELLQNM